MRVSNFGPVKKKTESNQRQIARYEYKNRAGRKKEKRKKKELSSVKRVAISTQQISNRDLRARRNKV